MECVAGCASLPALEMCGVQVPGLNRTGSKEMIDQTLMEPDQVDHDGASPESAVKMRLEFAERCFINSLELIRFMDLKANYLLSAVALLTAALGVVASKALDVAPDSDWAFWIKSAGMTSFLLFVATAFAVIYNATRVFRASSTILGGRTLAPGLIFPLSILGQFKAESEQDAERYFQKMSGLQSDDILRDYSREILEISSIYKSKHHRINLSLDLFRWLTIFWIVTILLLLALIVLR